MISVVICTHNPLPHFLTRVLEALRAQTLTMDQWELILVDNVSKPPLAPQFDLSWHPLGRVVVEEKVGLTYARWAGFRESRGDLLVYVDDDNVLATDYLAETARIAAEYPFLGAWGGQVLAQFDTALSPEEVPFIAWQLHWEPSEILWSNHFKSYADFPPGAGLAVRRRVLEVHMEKLARDPLRQMLGRSGSGGGCREDTDIVLTSLEVGLGMGQFPSLVLQHLTPPSRLTRAYCLRQAYAMGYSTVVLDRIWKRTPPLEKPTPISIARGWFHYLKMSPLERATHREKERGHREAHAMLKAFDAEAAAPTH